MLTVSDLSVAPETFPYRSDGVNNREEIALTAVPEAALLPPLPATAAWIYAVYFAQRFFDHGTQLDK